MAVLAEGRLAAVDAYVAKSAGFAQPVLMHLRDVVHEGATGVEEAIKWSMPFFIYKGVILANMSAFKAHCSFGLWGAELAKSLREEGVAQGGAMGSFGKITLVAELPPRKKLVGYVKAAAKAIDEGTRTKAWSRPKVVKAESEIPAALALALKKNKAAAKIFETKGAGYRREYCDWIAAAKREETRERRVVEAVGWIGEGKGRNWKYETA
jgi:uncharacterized protein YdeI (YjbR/CyaY-like superfamily)